MSVRPAKKKKVRPERIVARLHVARAFARVPTHRLLDEALVVASIVELHAAPCDAHPGLASVCPVLGPSFASDLRALEERARELDRLRPPRLARGEMAAIHAHVRDVAATVLAELPKLSGPRAEALGEAFEAFVVRHADARVCHEVHEALLVLAQVLDVYARVTLAPSRVAELRAESYRHFVVVDEVVARKVAWSSVHASIPGALTKTLVAIERMLALVREAAGAVLWGRCHEAYVAVMGSALREPMRPPRAEDSTPRLGSVDGLRPMLALPKAS